ncbi:unnamed protein product [Phaeothamnion confervicola]
MTPQNWHDSMYYSGSYFMPLWRDTLQYTRDKAAEFCGGAHRCTYIEVGSGTGDVLLGVASDFRYSVGVDINRAFLDYSVEHVPNNIRDKVQFVEGSATELRSLLDAEVPGARKGPVVVSCVNNTIGIFPEAIKPATYRQMREVAGPEGIVIVGFWNGNRFGDALQHFYSKHPNLCGVMEGASIDWERCTLRTRDGYLTHWTTPAEARQVLEKYDFDIIEIKEIGAGVLCTCRGKAASLASGSAAAGSAVTVMAGWAPAHLADVSALELNATAIYDDSYSQYFYREVWGGKTMHVGYYGDCELEALSPAQRVVAACDAATTKLFSVLAPPRGGRVVDFGSGFGSTARYAAAHFGARVTCVDLSLKANEVNRKLTQAAGHEVAALVRIGGERSFFETGEPAGAYDMVVSQDALCHAADQTGRALAEAARVLAPGGVLVCTNIVRDEQADAAELRQVLARLKLSGLESAESLVATAAAAGLELLHHEDRSRSMIEHYATLAVVLREKRVAVLQNTSAEYVRQLAAGLGHWEAAASNGMLRWGYFAFRKNAAV